MVVAMVLNFLVLTASFFLTPIIAFFGFPGLVISAFKALVIAFAFFVASALVIEI